MYGSFQGIDYRYFGYVVKDDNEWRNRYKKVVKCIIINKFVKEANIRLSTST